MRNTFLNELRNDRRAPPQVPLDATGDDPAGLADLEPAADTASPSALLRRGETRRKVQEAVRQLPAEQQEVVRLALLDGWTYVAIADKLGCDESTVRYRLREALPRLRVLLRELR